MKILIFLLFLLGSVSTKSAISGELQDKSRVIGNYEISDCRDKGFFARTIIQDMFHGKTREVALKANKLNPLINDKYYKAQNRRKENVINYLYDHDGKLSFENSTEYERLDYISLLSVEVMANCLGFNEGFQD